MAKCFVLSALLSGTCLAQITSFSFTSSPESKIGLGESRMITPADGYTFSAMRNFQNGVSLSITNASHSDWWTLDFATSGGSVLTPRLYDNATRFPFNIVADPSQPHPGFAFGGNGRFGDRLTAVFQVVEATYAEDGSVNSFAAYFRQTDELRMNAWNDGFIQYNAFDAAVAVPESSTLGLAGAALCIVAVVTRHKRQKI